MIRYALKCDEDHGFESWFRSADAYDNVRASGMVSCPVCGSTQVQKAVMAPQVSNTRDGAAPATGPVEDPRIAAIRKLKQKIERESEYVGDRFATEARAIHAGESADRPIYGEARLDEARKLAEEGVPIAPLPFLPSRKLS